MIKRDVLGNNKGFLTRIPREVQNRVERSGESVTVLHIYKPGCSRGETLEYVEADLADEIERIFDELTQ